MLAALEPVLADSRPDLVLVYGDTNSTLAGALAAAQAPVPVAHVEAGMRSFDRAMPEELNRVLTDHASDLLFCSTQTAVENLERESVAGAVHLVGDVMADVSLAFAPIAAERSRALDDAGVEPGDYLPRDRAPRRATSTTQQRLERLVALIERLDGAVVFPLHPRTAKRLDEAGLRERLEAAATAHAAARLPRLPRARAERARRPDRLRRRAEGGVPAGHAVRDAARHDRVGGDGRGGLERARRPRSGGGAARARASPP